MKFVLLTFMLLCAIAAGQGDQKDAALLPDGPGKPAVIKMCIDCHDTGNFRKARLSAEEWSDSVADMMQRGAAGTPAEVDAVVAYLDKFFGKGAPVRINTAPFAEIRVVLGFSVPEVRALLEYRDKNGPFKTVEDLGKVPGLDAAKVAAQKAKILISE